MCKYGECKYFKNGKCTKENEIAKFSVEQLFKAMISGKCILRKEKQ